MKLLLPMEVVAMGGNTYGALTIPPPPPPPLLLVLVDTVTADVVVTVLLLSIGACMSQPLRLLLLDVWFSSMVAVLRVCCTSLISSLMINQPRRIITHNKMIISDLNCSSHAYIYMISMGCTILIDIFEVNLRKIKVPMHVSPVA